MLFPETNKKYYVTYDRTVKLGCKNADRYLDNNIEIYINIENSSKKDCYDCYTANELIEFLLKEKKFTKIK